jgi:hypothetical protein
MTLATALLIHIVVGAMPIELQMPICVNVLAVVRARTHSGSSTVPENVCVVHFAKNDQHLSPCGKRFNQLFVKLRNIGGENRFLARCQGEWRAMDLVQVGWWLRDRPDRNSRRS